jgi:hypothetical protein
LEIALEVYVWNGVEHGYPATAAQFDQLLALYDLYDQNGGLPSAELQGLPIGPELNNAVYAAYRHLRDRRKLGHVRADLLRRVKLCPICGISAPRELDHHLPRSIYKPLSIYTRNLVPLCHDCNNIKRTEVGEHDDGLIHPYFEQLPNQQFIKASVNLSDGGLDARYEIDPEVQMSDALRSRLDYQLKRLKLNERYQRELNTYLVSQAASILMAYDALAAAGVSACLIMQARIESLAFHANNWRPVLLNALAVNEAFCDGGFRTVLPLP